MKTKSILLTVTFLLTALFTNGQISLGVSSFYEIPSADLESKLFGNEDRTLNYDLSFVEQKSSYSVGINIQQNFSKLFVETFVLYRKETNQFSIMDYKSDFRVEENFTETSHFLVMPVNAGVRFSNLNIGVGPIFKTPLKQSSKINERRSFERKSRALQMGFQFSASYTFLSKFKLQLRYETEFEDLGDHIYYRNENSRLKTKVKRLSMGMTVFI